MNYHSTNNNEQQASKKRRAEHELTPPDSKRNLPGFSRYAYDLKGYKLNALDFGKHAVPHPTNNTYQNPTVVPLHRTRQTFGVSGFQQLTPGDKKQGMPSYQRTEPYRNNVPAFPRAFYQNSTPVPQDVLINKSEYLKRGWRPPMEPSAYLNSHLKHERAIVPPSQRLREQLRRGSEQIGGGWEGWVGQQKNWDARPNVVSLRCDICQDSAKDFVVPKSGHLRPFVCDRCCRRPW